MRSEEKAELTPKLRLDSTIRTIFVSSRILLTLNVRVHVLFSFDWNELEDEHYKYDYK